MDHAENTEEFFPLWCISLEVNTTLGTLLLRHVVASHHFSRIRYLLAINRMGRYSLIVDRLFCCESLATR
jgi:hypothetical protein